jgi:hypothetical protein
LRGHYLALYGMIKSHSPRCRRHTILCETCRKLEGLAPHARRKGEWAHLDIARQHPPETAPTDGLVLVTIPPPAESSTGKVELRLDGTAVGAATLSFCGACRKATFDYVHIDAAYRQLGYRRTVVQAALARAPGYASTAPLPEGAIAQAFRSRISLSRSVQVCVHLESPVASRRG